MYMVMSTSVIFLPNFALVTHFASGSTHPVERIRQKVSLSHCMAHNVPVPRVLGVARAEETQGRVTKAIKKGIAMI